ncbi:sulfite exporter TauE/SafE family protein [Aliikangiella coralliicola]|uniref:Probable membrane transporter protein n=1 Tax=Aliikangiella coralliicola TaxID=2592383 RepID=A0A545UI34_9GAMM|nr:sulfite exporter TauE/SafE family protein [Aliikangiella coralliicola]TQV89120.1 sulfite exporter TauE/SafE family protein [Aliikangiella coralliicola]
MELWVIFILAGLLAGFLAGLLGIGGGFVVVPVLIWALPAAGVSVEHVAHFAIGTSLLSICVTAISSARAHHKKQAVDWRLFAIIAPGLVIGSLAGAALAAVLSGRLLIIVFVTGAILTAIYLLSGHKPKAHPTESRWPFFSYGNFTGVVSALIGIGGGSVLVPFLVYKGKSMVQSVGTAAACGFPIALFGALGYGISGWQQKINVEYSTGYLYWPAFFGIVVFSSLSAPLGAKLAHFVSEQRLKQIFAVFLFFTSGQILYSHWF